MTRTPAAPPRRRPRRSPAAILLALLFATAPAAEGGEAPEAFTGEKGSWHGFDRYDFLMDEANFTIAPFKAPTDEKNAVKAQVKGQLRCVVVVPREAAAGKPWSWQGYYFDHEP